MKIDTGDDIQAKQMGGNLAGKAGTSSAIGTATTLTDAAGAFGTNLYVGHMVVTNGVYGIIQSHTATVLTVDRWYTPSTPGGAAGGIPPTTTPYVIVPGNAPAWYMALTATATAPSSTDTVLTGEIATVGGGLIRQLAAYAHTGGAASYTLTGTFTANGTDALPVTIAQMATFQSLVASTGMMLFRTLLSPGTATLSASGDQLTVTQTVST